MQQHVFGAIREQWIHLRIYVWLKRYHAGGFCIPASPPQLLLRPHLAIREGVNHLRLEVHRHYLKFALVKYVVRVSIEENDEI